VQAPRGSSLPWARSGHEALVTLSGWGLVQHGQEMFVGLPIDPDQGLVEQRLLGGVFDVELVQAAGAQQPGLFIRPGNNVDVVEACPLGSLSMRLAVMRLGPPSSGMSKFFWCRMLKGMSSSPVRPACGSAVAVGARNEPHILTASSCAACRSNSSPTRPFQAKPTSLSGGSPADWEYLRL